MADDLIVAETLKADLVFAPGGVDAVLDKLERDVRATPTDISTKAGRAAVSSLAHKVARSKTALDELGKNLVADWKARSAAVDADRRRVRERLDSLRDEVRRPLTEWEDAERRRVEGHERMLAEIESFTRFTAAEPTAEAVALRVAQLNKVIDTPREWHEFAKRAADTTAAMKATLLASYDVAIRREAERDELARLRKGAEERAQRERDERLQREAAERARAVAEAEAREAARVQAAKEAAERARVERERVAAEEARLAAEAAAERTKRDAEEAAKQEAERVECARIAAGEKAKRDAEAAVEAERTWVAAKKQAAEEEVARRERDERHRETVHQVIADDLVRRGLTPKNAGVVVRMLATGGVPHVRVVY